MKNLRIALFGSYNHKLPSSTLIQTGLLKLPSVHTVTVIHEPVPVSFIQNASHLTATEMFKRLWHRVTAFVKLLTRFREVLAVDALVLLTPGHVDMIQAAVYRFLFGKKVLFIPQISFYDLLRTILKDEPSKQFIVTLAYHFERLLFRCANIVVFNTQAEAEYHKKLLNLPNLRVAVIPLGADDTLFYPGTAKKFSKVFEVLYYGEYIPAHGAKTVAKAAVDLAKDSHLHFTMIGEGKDKEAVVEIVGKSKHKNIELKGWMSPQELAEHIRKADVVIGMLGKDPLVQRAVPNKVYQGMATQKPVITSTSPALSEPFKHGENIYVIPAEDKKALETAILELDTHPTVRNKIAKNAYTTFSQYFTSGAIASAIVSQLETLF